MPNYFADVSSHNRSDLAYFQGLKQAGAIAVVIKLTEGCQHGTNYRNPKAYEQITNAKKAGLIVHYYHYYHATDPQDAKCEADFFISYANELNADKRAVMVCDFEEAHITSRSQNTANLNAFFDRVKEYGYMDTDTYSYTSFFNSYMNIKDLSTKNIWQADYNSLRGDIGVIAGSWQYTSNLNVLGNNTDFSIDYNNFYTSPYGSQETPAKPAEDPKTTFTDDLGVKWYIEDGTFTLDDNIKLRWGASVNSTVIATIKKGSSIKYDAFCYSGGYIWIRQPRGNGQFGYMATGTEKDGHRLDYWGKFS